MEYFDKFGKQIRSGMTIQHYSGETDLVYDTTDAFGEPDLGVMATNPDYLKHHPDADIEYYSLCNFDMREWEIIDEGQEKLKS